MEKEGKHMEYVLHIDSVLNMFFDIVHPVITYGFIILKILSGILSPHFLEKKGIMWTQAFLLLKFRHSKFQKKNLETWQAF